ncbi:MAG: hypothetical protein Q7S32_03005 [bacterium]|nr:hypothetical protein [bacterium]
MADEIIGEINSGDQSFIGVKPHSVVINGLEVVEWEEYGFCDYAIVEVIGKKANYQLSKICGGEIPELENFVKTMKLID